MAKTKNSKLDKIKEFQIYFLGISAGLFLAIIVVAILEVLGG